MKTHEELRKECAEILEYHNRLENGLQYAETLDAMMEVAAKAFKEGVEATNTVEYSSDNSKIIINPYLKPE